MSEIFILYLDSTDRDLYTKLLKVINESGHGIKKISTESDMLLQFRDLKILPNRHQVFQSGKEIILTGKEFEVLMQNRGRVFSKEQIYDTIWNNEYIFDERNMTSSNCNKYFSYIINPPWIKW